MKVRLLYVHALSPLHAGTGQSVGAIELAIARDRATGFPYLPGSSLKGSLRARSQDSETKTKSTVAVFGPDTQSAHEHAGAIVLGDANLLLFPVRSVAGTFAWATSPYLLARFGRDCAEAKAGALPQIPPPEKEEILLTSTSALQVGVGGAQRVVFEDLDLGPVARPGNPVDALATFLGGQLFPNDTEWSRSLTSRLCIVHDDVMSFLCEHATDVVARVKLKEDSKTVDHLWHEESLPVESVLVSLVLAAPNGKTGMAPPALFDEVAALCKKPIQLGGKATVGRGRCRLVLAGGGAK